MSAISDWFRKAWLVLLVAGIVVALDQWTKQLVRANFPKFETIVPIKGLGAYLMFEHVDNYGAAFGMFQNMGGVFVIVALLVVGVMLFYVRYLPTDGWLVRVLLGLMLGGAIGNLLDRLQQGFVTDFIKTGIPGFYYIPNYNIADSAIVCGVIGLGIYLIFDDYKRSRHEKQLASDATHAAPDTGSHSD
jgi:signal peptidase II